MDLRLSNLRYKTLVIADYEHVKISKIAVMDIKLWMKKDLDLRTDHLYHRYLNEKNLIHGRETATTGKIWCTEFSNVL